MQEFLDFVVRQLIDYPDEMILSKIEAAGLKDSCFFVSRCGLDGEIVERDFSRMAKIKQPNYLSLMVIKRKGLENGKCVETAKE